mmetsp:Transcript_22747/g.54858  ORF Transcript_22747/g.54858 Transcript_22747/m.54858 type:complete len:258 (+) Transcript_22747:278-1051(+)
MSCDCVGFPLEQIENSNCGVDYLSPIPMTYMPYECCCPSYHHRQVRGLVVLVLPLHQLLMPAWFGAYSSSFWSCAWSYFSSSKIENMNCGVDHSSPTRMKILTQRSCCPTYHRQLEGRVVLVLSPRQLLPPCQGQCHPNIIHASSHHPEPESRAFPSLIKKHATTSAKTCETAYCAAPNGVVHAVVNHSSNVQNYAAVTDEYLVRNHASSTGHCSVEGYVLVDTANDPVLVGKITRSHFFHHSCILNGLDIPAPRPC